MSKKEKPEYAYIIPLIRGEFNLIALKEYKFYQGRNWRFDFAIPKYRFAIEIEGGIWSGGGHVRGGGYIGNMEKYNEAALAGWTVLRFTPQQIADREYLDKLRLFLYNRGVITTSPP